jgi:predicted kinase
MIKKIAIITIGPSASGKTTFANSGAISSQYVKIERDEIRSMIFMDKTNRPFTWNEWNWKWEKAVNDIYFEKIKQCADRKLNIILSDTNLNSVKRNKIINLLNELDFSVEMKFFTETANYYECVKRDLERRNSVGESVIMRQFVQMKADKNIPGNTADQQEQLKCNMLLEPCIIVDLDGTLAIAQNRSPYDFLQVHTDVKNNSIAQIVNMFYKNGKRIFIFSGRDDSSKDLTIEWLNKNHICYHELHMRKTSDFRKDYKIKNELLLEHILNKFRVELVIDDRPQVTKFWKFEYDLPLLHVGNPWIEF